jgi:hypothetical protein
MSDKPKVDLVLADLEKEIQEPEPYTVVIKGGKRITFKDPFDFTLDEREHIMNLLQGMERGTVDDLEFLAEIMTKTDLEAYKKSNPKIRTHNTLMQRVMRHFQGALGESNG